MKRTPPGDGPRRRGAFLAAGASFRLWRHYPDPYVRRRAWAVALDPARGDEAEAAALPAGMAPCAPAAWPPWWFGPLPVPAAGRRCVPVSGVATGSRTLALDPASARRLGLPATLALDLAQAGWGTGTLDLRPEVKGAGCPLSRTRLSGSAAELAAQMRSALAAAAGQDPEPVAARRRLAGWGAAFATAADPPFASLHAFEGRPLGSQAYAHGVHAVRSSLALLGRCPVRVAPTVACAAAPPAFAAALAALMPPAGRGGSRFGGRLASELRYTPGHVRAAYFDTARSDAERLALARAVARDDAQLAATWEAIVGDLRRHLETLAVGTRRVRRPDCLVWPKFGDIHIVFRTDRHGERAWAQEYLHRKRAAWYLAKDEVVVGGVGKVVVDGESVAPVFPSRDPEQLAWQHELVALNLLRDHARVACGFLHAWQLARHAAGGPPPGSQQQRDRSCLAALLADSRRSDLYALEADPHGVVLALRYPRLRHAAAYRFDWRQVIGRRPWG